MANITTQHQTLQRKQPVSSITQEIRKNRPVTLIDAVGRSGTALAVYNKNGVKSQVLQHIKICLIETLQYLGAFEITSEYQVQKMSERINAVAYWLSMEELDFFFQSFCDGIYGKLYGGRAVNPQDIMQALQTYMRDVQEARGDAENIKRQENERQEAIEAKRNAITYEEYARLKGKNIGEDEPDILELARLNLNKSTRNEGGNLQSNQGRGGSEEGAKTNSIPCTTE